MKYLGWPCLGAGGCLAKHTCMVRIHANTQSNSSSPADRVISSITDFPWASLGRATVVDVGGGVGTLPWKSPQQNLTDGQVFDFSELELISVNHVDRWLLLAIGSFIPRPQVRTSGSRPSFATGRVQYLAQGRSGGSGARPCQIRASRFLSPQSREERRRVLASIYSA